MEQAVELKQVMQPVNEHGPHVPVIESKNGWIKKEMYIDFDINNYNTVQEFIDDIVWDNNNYRPSYALQYKNPVEYRTQLGFK